MHRLFLTIQGTDIYECVKFGADPYVNPDYL